MQVGSKRESDGLSRRKGRASHPIGVTDHAEARHDRGEGIGNIAEFIVPQARGLCYALGVGDN